MLIVDSVDSALCDGYYPTFGMSILNKLLVIQRIIRSQSTIDSQEEGNYESGHHVEKDTIMSKSSATYAMLFPFAIPSAFILFMVALTLFMLKRSKSRHGCHMAIAGFLACMRLALRASGLWLRYAALQNWIPSFPWIAPPRPPPWRNPRKGRDPILPSGNRVGRRHRSDTLCPPNCR